MGKESTSGATAVHMRDNFSRERGRAEVSGRELMEIYSRDNILKTWKTDGANSSGSTDKYTKASSKTMWGMARGLTNTPVANWANSCGRRARLTTEYTARKKSSIGAAAEEGTSSRKSRNSCSSMWKRRISMRRWSETDLNIHKLWYSTS